MREGKLPAGFDPAMVIRHENDFNSISEPDDKPDDQDILSRN